MAANAAPSNGAEPIAADATDSTQTQAVPVMAPSGKQVEPCHEWDKYNQRAQVSEIQMSNCNVTDPTLGGLRPYLAAHGWGFEAAGLGGINYDVLGHNQGKQLYGGQRPTGNGEVWPALMYDLSRLKVPGNAQLTIKGTWFDSSYFHTDRFMGVNILAINHQWNKGAVELQYGFYTLVHAFYGEILGGNSALAAYGPQSSVLVEAGMSKVAPTPAIQLVVRNPKTRHIYNNFIATRSTSPAGLTKDSELNPTGLRGWVSGERLLALNEIGYNRGPVGYVPSQSLGPKGFWVRAGGLVNLSDYSNYLTGQKRSNYAWFAAGTVELAKFAENSRRGLYFDSKCDYSPGAVNTFFHDYNMTLFTLGMGPRPLRGDMASVSWAASYVSPQLRQHYTGEGISSAHTTGSYAASYSHRLFRGTYLVSSITKTMDPTTSPIKPPALFIAGTLHTTF
jgi:porin